MIFLVIFIVGVILVHVNYDKLLENRTLVRSSASSLNNSIETEHSKVRILCMITTEWEHHKTKVRTCPVQPNKRHILAEIDFYSGSCCLLHLGLQV